VNGQRVQNFEEIEKQILDAIFRQDDRPQEHPKNGGLPVGDREPCRRQAYASFELARRAVINLAKLDIIAEVVRCHTCGLIHLKEMRITNGA
jgi:hypothetical protein